MDVGIVRKKVGQDPILSPLLMLARKKKIPLYLVGGYIRDLFLQIPSGDYDFALAKDFSSCIPEIEKTLQVSFFQVGKEELGTITFRVIQSNMSIDLTFLQGKTIEEDLKRRDFTINALAFSLLDETLHEVKGASEDLRDRRIRVVSTHAIDQDPLRMLRALRYLCTLERFEIDAALKEEIRKKKGLIAKVPGERIKMELDQILLSHRPALGIRSLYESSLLLTLLPALRGLEDLGQNEHHHLNVLSHTFLMVEKIRWAFEWVGLHDKKISLTQEDWLSLYYAALFHDLGKQDTYSKDETGNVHFYHHESDSCDRAEAIMEPLRFSNPLKSRILRIVRNHMRILNLSRETKETALKRLVHQVGEETPLLVLHTLADKEASRGILSVQKDEVVEAHCLRLLDLFEENEVVHPPTLVTGHDVMALGYPSGPRIGNILSYIRQKQVEGEIKTREEALRVLRERFS